jgi:hypothetical protein
MLSPARVAANGEFVLGYEVIPGWTPSNRIDANLGLSIVMCACTVCFAAGLRQRRGKRVEERKKAEALAASPLPSLFPC